MSQNESPQPARSPGPRFSRDTMLLVGALAFLIGAVTLTFLFTPNSGTQTAQLAQTSSASALTNVPALTDTVGYPTASSGTPSGNLLPSPSVDAGFGGGAYPGVISAYPGSESDTLRVTTPSPDSSVVPDVIATRTAIAQRENQTVLSLDSTASVENNDPGPEPVGTSPRQPTFHPAVLTATPELRANQSSPTPPPPPPTSPPPTDPPVPTSAPEYPKEPLATATTAPTAIPVDVLRGHVRWSIDNSPITVRRDVQIAPGAELLVEPGVEIRLDPGVSIYVDAARLLLMGTSDQPVRFVGNTKARWSGIFGRPGSFVLIENTQISGGGAGGTVMAIESGELIIHGSRVFDNGGGMLVNDTKLDMKDTEIAGNDVPFGAALDASFARGTTVTLQRNRIGGNRLSEGAPMVRIANQSTIDTLLLDISGNLFRNGTPNLQFYANGPLQGSVACNTLVYDGQGFGLRSQTIQVNANGSPPFALSFQNNLIDDHIPPIIPVYLKYGLGRGATSEIMIDMRNNWWGDASGPYEPDVNPLGRGDSVGSNILFSPWLTQAPACVPSR
ncbi:MAG: hypothetical protein HGA65_09775 [Oscillochloris sp.]|nr:hypothetical protein [Oscillochloris sp.]